MNRNARTALAALIVVAMVSLQAAGADEPEHFLEYSEYNFAVNFISGNLTATVTPATIVPRDWPRIIFHHSTDILSPTFDVGISSVYLFNDTNGDGVFARSEATYVAHLSSLYNVTWNATAVEFSNDTLSGEYAWLNASSVIGLFADADDEYPIIDRWANVSFTFRISQRPESRSNAYGNYVVQGMIDIRVNFAIDILEPVNASGLAVEQELWAGGSTSMFMLMEDEGNSSPELTMANSREDETIFGDNFTHPLRMTVLPNQQILFAKEDQTVQAHLMISSAPDSCDGLVTREAPMGISYYTTGRGLVVHNAYFVDLRNETISHELIVGIDEAGFTPHFRDWLKENLPLVMIVAGSVAAVISFTVLMLLLRKHWGWGKRVAKAEESEKKDEAPVTPK